jgi:hypothetical protein
MKDAPYTTIIDMKGLLLEREITKTAILTFIELLILFAFMIFSLTVEFLTCPQCFGDFSKMHNCLICGKDGKVTLFQYLIYYLRGIL